MNRNRAAILGLRGTPDQVLAQARASHLSLLDKDSKVLQQSGHYGGVQSLLEAADLKTDTAGVLNKVFGGDFVWAQFNARAQIADSIPSTQRSKGSPYGWRAWTSLGSSGLGGQAEGTVPAAVIGGFVEVAPTIKEHSTQMRVSLLQQNLVGIDDAYGSLVQLQMQLATEHARERERATTKDIDTLQGTNTLSIDTLTASSANQAAIGWTAGDEDVYGIDRSAQTWANAQQDAAAVARTLTKKLLKDRIRAIRNAGGSPTYIATGHDTMMALSTLYEAAGRVNIAVANQTGKVGGADVLPGVAVTQLINDVEGLPVVASDLAHADANEISRMYFLDVTNPDAADKPRLGWDIVGPTRVYAAGATAGPAPQAIGFVGDSLLATTQYELGCRFMAAQGQLRDLTAP
jgi:hypothetical protein